MEKIDWADSYLFWYGEALFLVLRAAFGGAELSGMETDNESGLKNIS